MRWMRMWSRRHNPAMRPLRRPRDIVDVPPPQADGDDAPPRGCAWFDSSHELRHGLVVRELRPGPELQLLLWLQQPA